MPPTVALVNQKGGVGKTSVTLGLASAAWAAGDRVLVVDLDPQGSATWLLGLEPDDRLTSVAEVLAGGRQNRVSDAIVVSSWGDQVHLMPAVPRLAAHDGPLQLRSRKDRLDGLATGLAPLTDHYDAILIDCPPNLGTLTMNGLVAAEHALIVVEPSVLSIRGIPAVKGAVDELWTRPGARVSLAGVVVNKLPALSSDAERQFLALGQAAEGVPVWRPAIPQRVAVPKAASARQPVHAIGSQATDVADAFDHLWLRLRRLLRRTAAGVGPRPD
jgi:cellulose biosynthesis protein BcsQ